VLSLVGDGERLPRSPRELLPRDGRGLEVVRENRLAAHAEGRRPIGPGAIDANDPRWVLAMQTQARLHGATLTPERRDELMKSGTRLGLRAFETNLVIAVVQDRARTNQPLRLAQSALSLMPVAAPQIKARQRTATMLRWFLAGAGAAGFATLIMRWLTMAS
jgi:hypothetical protein